MTCPLYEGKKVGLFADKKNCGTCERWDGKRCKEEARLKGVTE